MLSYIEPKLIVDSSSASLDFAESIVLPDKNHADMNKFDENDENYRRVVGVLIKMCQRPTRSDIR